ncbi:MAG: acetyl-CoA carboxylase biotin carboxyl carrier protein [Gammaproteobacteria bacterium]
MSDKYDPPLTADDIAEIVAALDGSPYDSLELSTGRYKLTITREGDGWSRETETLTEPNIADETAVSADSGAEKQAGAESKPAEDGLVDVTAPMMGTLYRAPKPGADPFVEVGSRIEETTIIGIIEVMKLMNSIRAQVSGEVVEVCVENGKSVEQGQTLLRVKPD